MQLDSLLLSRQDSGGDCIKTCEKPPPCNCTPAQECILINRDCHTCSTTTCVAKKGANKVAGGVSKGALAGGILGALIFLALSFSLYFWYRRKSRLRKIIAKSRGTQKDTPASAADVLSRPDPIEKLPSPLPSQPAQSTATTVVDPESHGTTLPPPARPQFVNPFDDTHSIQTTRTEGTNAIPIALVSPDYRRSKTETDTLPSTTSSGPVRPARSPDLNLNLEHVNVSHDNLRVPYASSTISGISAISRNSYLSNASYSSDFIHEAPVIVTANTGAVRQMLNVVKAEVVSTGPVSPPSDGLKPPSFASRPVVTSPLAATSFGPSDVLNEADESNVVDPFDDTHSTTAQGSTSPAVRTFDHASRPESTDSNWVPNGPMLPWSRSEDSRPSSISTQAGSIVNIGSATRVNVGLGGLASLTSTTPISRSTSYRTTMGRLISPLSSDSVQSGTLQEQQVRAFAFAQAQAQSQGIKRISGSSVVSATSTRADSILEAFPFVPPSPISDRPVRSPPVSPLGKQSFTTSPAPSLAQPTVTVAPPSPLNQPTFVNNAPPRSQDDDDALPTPPNRRTLGMSTGSQLSTTSTGLGSFPFQIDSGARGDINSNSRPNTLSIRQRASLDTLALTSDLASYPLDFERDSVPLVPQRKI